MKRYFNFFRRTVPLLKLIKVYDAREDVHSVFGLILYTEQHPFVVKVLRDDDFWSALDSTSGLRWPVMAIRPKPGTTTTGYPNFPPGTIGMMVMITEWHEPRENQELLETFQIDDTSHLPLLLVFTELPSGEIAQLQWRFEAGNTTEECFKSLNSVLQTAQEAISQVTAPHIKSNEAVMNLIRNAHLQVKIISGLKKGLSIGTWVKDLATTFKGS